MKKVIGLVAIAGLAAVSYGQQGNTLLEVQVSTDGLTWSNSVNANPGTEVQVRYRVTLSGATALGFQGINFQPVFNGWDSAGASDSMRPYANIGSNTSGAVDDLPGNPAPYGRIRPYGAPNVTAANALTTHSDSPTSVRIAQLPTTNPVGSGSNSNNVNGSGGVPISQNVGTFQLPPTFRLGTTDVVVLKLGIMLSTDTDARTIDATVPLGSLSLYGPAGNTTRAGNWLQGYNQDNGSPISNYALIDLTNAVGHINIIPTPGALALLGLGGLVVGRRRR